MLGFGALGQLALGQIGQSGVGSSYPVSGGGGARRRVVRDPAPQFVDDIPQRRPPKRWRERRAEPPLAPAPLAPAPEVPLPPDDWIAPTRPPGVLGPITSQVSVPDTSHIPRQIAEAHDMQDIMALLERMPDPEAEAAEQWLAQNFGGDDGPDESA
jgi:hypothetical protein